MMVLGMNTFIMESTRRTCSVNPFSSELGIVENVPIVDVLIAYDFQYNKNTYILIIRNGLYIPSMQYKIIPPFLMRAGGVIVKDIPKIHCNDIKSSDYCISF